MQFAGGAAVRWRSSLAIIPRSWILSASGRFGWWSFTASTEAKQPSQLLAAAPGTSYDMTGKVVPGSVRRNGDALRFRVADREGGGESIPVTYTGTVPDPFRGGREIVLTGEVEHGTFVGQRDTLVTKCPSKFTTKNDS